MDFEQLAKIENESERVNRTYDIFNEDARLNHSKAARVEFLTTVRYIEKYLKEGDKILDIGAGAGVPWIPWNGTPRLPQTAVFPRLLPRLSGRIRR